VDYFCGNIKTWIMKREDYLVHEHKGKGPSWKRSVVTDKNGVVYVPLLDKRIRMLAMFDGFPMLVLEKGTFLKTSDMVKICPKDCVEDVLSIERKFSQNTVSDEVA